MGQHEIKLRDGTSIFCRPYRIPDAFANRIKAEIDDLLKRKIIVRSQSNFASPAFPICKKDGSIKLIVYYRKLNKQMEKEVYPFPNIADTLSGLDGSVKFSSLDLQQR